MLVLRYWGLNLCLNCIEAGDFSRSKPRANVTYFCSSNWAANRDWRKWNPGNVVKMSRALFLQEISSSDRSWRRFDWDFLLIKSFQCPAPFLKRRGKPFSAFFLSSLQFHAWETFLLSQMREWNILMRLWRHCQNWVLNRVLELPSHLTSLVRYLVGRGDENNLLQKA